MIGLPCKSSQLSSSILPVVADLPVSGWYSDKHCPTAAKILGWAFRAPTLESCDSQNRGDQTVETLLSSNFDPDPQRSNTPYL